MAVLDDYLALITSQYRGQPKFAAMAALLMQPFAEAAELARAMPAHFDLDDAVGKQLDTLGLWIGRGRFVAVPIPDTFFTWDDTALTGWDAGAWLGVDELGSEERRLNDDQYRRLLLAKIAANNWKGDRAGQYEILRQAFGASGSVLIVDNKDMTQTVRINVGALTDLQRAMLTGGYVPIKPSGVGTNFEDFFLAPWTLTFFGGSFASAGFLYSWTQEERVVLGASDWAVGLAWMTFATETTVTLKRDGEAVGTITVPAGGTPTLENPTVAVAELLTDEAELPVGALMSLETTPDATGGSVGITLMGTRVP